MSVHPLIGGILSAHMHRPRFVERYEPEPDFTDVSVRIKLQEVPLRINGRTVARVDGEAEIIGDGSSWRIERMWIADQDTGALVLIAPPARTMSTLTDHVAAALEAEADRLAPVKLTEAM